MRTNLRGNVGLALGLVLVAFLILSIMVWRFMPRSVQVLSDPNVNKWQSSGQERGPGLGPGATGVRPPPR